MNLQKNVLLKDYTTFKIGGPARWFFQAENLRDLKEAFAWAKENGERVFVLGGGSNMIFSDEGFEGLIIRIKNQELRMSSSLQGFASQEINNSQFTIHNSKVICGAGVMLSKLVNFARDNSLSGIEWAAGIPGTVGGAVRGNAGAFGGEMKDNILLVKGFRLDDEFSADDDIIEFKKEACGFGYRNSIFKERDDLFVWEVMLELKEGDKEKIKKECEKIIRKRREKQPQLSEFPSAGSVFKNPVASREIIELFEKEKGVVCKDDKVPAGWVIEKCGLKGQKIGGAMISEKQANFIVNTGGASAKDVVELIELVKKEVKEKFQLEMEEEVVVCG